MQLVHYSPIPIYEPDDREYCNYHPEPKIVGGKVSAEKPDGLWVSVDDNGEGWKDFIELSELGLFKGSLQYAHEITLKADAHILTIQTADDMIEFSKSYKHDFQYPGLSYVFRSIHWDRVASEYQGIIISPYRYDFWENPYFTWYYSWDCASGVIWDVSAIATFQMRE